MGEQAAKPGQCAVGKPVGRPTVRAHLRGVSKVSCSGLMSAALHGSIRPELRAGTSVSERAVSLTQALLRRGAAQPLRIIALPI